MPILPHGKRPFPLSSFSQQSTVDPDCPSINSVWAGLRRKTSEDDLKDTSLVHALRKTWSSLALYGLLYKSRQCPLVSFVYFDNNTIFLFLPFLPWGTSAISSVMTWQEHCEKLEGRLRRTEEENGKLKQDLYGLERRLLESNPTDDLQRQLAQAIQERDAARREKDVIRNAALQQISQFRQQVVNAQQDRQNAEATSEETTHQNVLRKLEKLERELAEERQQKQQLQTRLAEQDRLLQEARAAAVQSAPISGGVSAKEHIAMLERQLKLSQRENARLQELSDRRPGKQCDDSDDSEPEYPRYESWTALFMDSADPL